MSGSENVPLNTAQMQTVLLRLLSGQGRRSFRATMGSPQAIAEQVAQEIEQDGRLAEEDVMEALWSLIGQGLVYLNFYQPHPSNWNFQLTTTGRAAAEDQLINPDSPDEYLQRLSRNVPDASETVMQYATEALRSYLGRCYLASSVMLGVASEAAFLEMAASFGSWLPAAEGEDFLEFVTKPRASYMEKFKQYRRRIGPHKPKLPDELADDMALSLDAILDLLRLYRNEAGHPTGKQISREQAKLNLEIFARYLQRLYAFKAFFDGHPA